MATYQAVIFLSALALTGALQYRNPTQTLTSRNGEEPASLLEVKQEQVMESKQMQLLKQASGARMIRQAMGKMKTGILQELALSFHDEDSKQSIPQLIKLLQLAKKNAKMGSMHRIGGAYARETNEIIDALKDIQGVKKEEKMLPSSMMEVASDAQLRMDISSPLWQSLPVFDRATSTTIKMTPQVMIKPKFENQFGDFDKNLDEECFYTDHHEKSTLEKSIVATVSMFQVRAGDVAALMKTDESTDKKASLLQAESIYDIKQEKVKKVSKAVQQGVLDARTELATIRSMYKGMPDVEHMVSNRHKKQGLELVTDGIESLEAVKKRAKSEEDELQALLKARQQEVSHITDNLKKVRKFSAETDGGLEVSKSVMMEFQKHEKDSKALLAAKANDSAIPDIAPEDQARQQKAVDGIVKGSKEQVVAGFEDGDASAQGYHPAKF